MPDIIIKDSLRSSVEAASGGQQTVLYDDQGQPSIMNIIPKFRYEDIHEALGTGLCSAFVVGGVEKSEIFISTYPNLIVNGRGVSMPGSRFSSVSRTAAKSACTAKGPGWHLLTNHEWAAIALWCAVRGIVPRGNTFYGRSHVPGKHYESGVRWDGRDPGDTRSGGTPYTLGGSGPKEWNHDLTVNGIADLVGNRWEHIDLFELRDGQIFTTLDNAHGTSEDEWPATGVFFDAAAPPVGDGSCHCGAMLAQNVTNSTLADGAEQEDCAGQTWAALSAASGFDIPLWAKQQLIAPIAPNDDFSMLSEGRLYIRNTGRRCALRGGSYLSTSGAGLGGLNCSIDPTFTAAFRAAFTQ